MKVITSYGGPFVGLDSKSIAAWSGIDGKRFIGEASPHINDYEAGGFLTEGIAHPPCNIAKIDGEVHSAFLISIGYDLFLMESSSRELYMFQVPYADDEFIENTITRNDFDKAYFDPNECIHLAFETGEIKIFDSAMSGNEASENTLDIKLMPGAYTLSTSIYNPDETAQIFLHKLIRDV